MYIDKASRTKIVFWKNAFYLGMTLKNYTSLASHRISQYFFIKQEIKQTIIIAPIAFAAPKNFILFDF